MYKRCLVFLLAALVASGALAQGKKRIERAADLPRFTYRIEGKLEDLVRDPAAFSRFADQVRRDDQSVLDQYDIADKSAQRGLLGVLARIDFLEGRYADAERRATRFEDEAGHRPERTPGRRVARTAETGTRLAVGSWAHPAADLDAGSG